jgi:glycosidase
MYEQFGAAEVGNTGQVRFRVFIPDAGLDPGQYQRGQASTIQTIEVFGDFQSALGGVDWAKEPAFTLARSQFVDPADGRAKGWLYELTTGPLPEGFYQYKLWVTFASGAERKVCDPCTRYGGADSQNSAFVIGGPKRDTAPLANPSPPAELVIYELMIDDFTAGFRAGRAPLAAVVDKLGDLQALGVNAVEFMPWTQWPGANYDWGYTPQGYFAVAYPYTLNPADDAEKLFLLKTLVSRCHELGLHVIFDGVFDHVTDAGVASGFGYRWLWENPDDSPYCGHFSDAQYGQDLDYNNGCLLEFIVDVCCYWIDVFKIDGIRFDESSGFYDATRSTLGLPALITRLRAELARRNLDRFPLFLEHTWDYDSIHVADVVNATGCWLDPFRSRSRGFLSGRQIEPAVMRLLDAGRDFAVDARPVTYIENHDHESIALNAGSRDEWWRTQPYAIALFTAAGVPLIHNGQEYAEIYRMPEIGAETGPGDSRDPGQRRVVPRPLRWTTDDGAGTSTRALYRTLIALRRGHAGLTSLNFHPTGWSESEAMPDRDGFGIDRGRQTVVFHRWGNASDGRLEKFYVVLNFSSGPQTVSVSFPENDGWEDLLSGWRPPVRNNWLTFEVGSNWGHVFYKKY